MKASKIAVAVVAGATAVAAYATEGINLIGVGPRQQGTAGAGVASAKDSTWFILNPAGLTDVRRSVDTSFQVFGPSRTIDSTANPGSGEQKDDSAFFIPSLSASLMCCNNNRNFFGVGLYGTSGMGVDYDKPRVGFSTGDTRTELSIAKLTATYAHAFDNGLSVGIGPVLVLGRFRTDMETSQVGPPSAAAPDSWDDAFGVGAIVGVNQKINDSLSVGASYITEQVMEKYDDYSMLFLDSLNLPQQFTVGLAYDVVESVELVLDYRWIGWGQIDTFGDQFGWDDQHLVKFGATWQASEALILRAGVSHGNSPLDSDVVFANALFPAIMETHLTLGASYQLDRLGIHFAYVHGLEEEITDSGPPMMGGGTTISMVQNSATLGLSWDF
jgi:long-chain fatty acid transport protein